ncbi:MAG: hypothetical protein M3N08_09650 [Pseudomonadota bacterium]|nr:hypothetical protein [Pseudomonadota bacterium]
MKDPANQGRFFNPLWRLLLSGVLGFFMVTAAAKPAEAQSCPPTLLVGLCGFDCAAVATCTMDLSIFTGAAAVTTLIGTQTAVLSGILLDPIFGLPGIDDDIVGGFDDVIEAINQHATESAPLAAQVGADARKYYGAVQGTADLSSDALVSEKSIHCATAYGLQARTQMGGPTRALDRFVTNAIARDQDAGAAASTGPGVMAQTLCESAPFRANSPRYGVVMANALATCKDPTGTPMVAAPAKFIDADLDAGSVFDVMQVETLPTMPKSANGHAIFPTPVNDDQWAYLAAWRFCEHLLPFRAEAPNSTNNLTVSDIQRAAADLSSIAFKTPAIETCMHAIAYRTACPQASEANFVATSGATAGIECYHTQIAACHRLKDPPPEGQGINNVGNEEANAALANCDANGISQMMVDYIWAHRCADETFMSATVPQNHANTSRDEQKEKECRADIADFEKAQRDDRLNYMYALRLLMKTHTAPGNSVNPGARQIF